jgi:exonuclease VII large subunit
MTGFRRYTTADLADRMEQWLLEVTRRLEGGSGSVSVTGQLTYIPEPKRHGIIYDVQLTDPVSPDKVVLLEVRSSTLQEVDARVGGRITAYGSVISDYFKDRAKLRLKVHQLEISETPETREERTAQQSTLDIIRQVGARRNAFPCSSNPNIALLRSGSSDVCADFLEELGDMSKDLQIEHIEVSMTNPADIAEKIRNCSADIMVLIRGGGDEGEFMVFDSPAVLEALGGSRSFRLLALGHTRHRTLADCIADHVENVPANAGRFLKSKLSKQKQELFNVQELINLRNMVKSQVASREIGVENRQRKLESRWSTRIVSALMIIVFIVGAAVALLIARLVM